MSWLNDANVKTAEELVRARKDSLINQVGTQRKAAETEGVVLKGIRYDGSPENRQALREALDMAEDAGFEVFPTWKDSDNKFQTDLPVEDVLNALRAIGHRRNALITLEAHYVQQIEEGKLTDTEGLSWDG